MNTLSGNGYFVLHQILGFLNEKTDIFYYTEGISSITFGPLRKDNIIPPTSNVELTQLQKDRKNIANGLQELIDHKIVIKIGRKEKNILLRINTDILNDYLVDS